MLRWLKWLALAFALFIALVALIFWYIYDVSDRAIEQRPAPAQRTIEFPDEATHESRLERGAHLYQTRGCVDCHGVHGEGTVVIGEWPMGKLVATNLTSARSAYTSDTDWSRAVRQGIAPDGRKLLFMPSHEYTRTTDADLSAIVAYIVSLPVTDSDLPPMSIGPLARVLWWLGAFNLIPADTIDHSYVAASSIAAGPSTTYGNYLLDGCTGCHGTGLSGGPIPGAPPDWPTATNLTMHETGLADWTFNDFVRAMREGRRPDGSPISKVMPWPSLGKMHDWELRAIWSALAAAPPRPSGQR